jgi:hypothetical protein
MRHPSALLRLPASALRPVFLAALILFAVTSAAAQETSPPKFTVKPLSLPGANGLVMLDYFAYDHPSRRLWVPAVCSSPALNRGPASTDIASNSGKPTSKQSLHENRVYSVLLYCLASHPIQFERRSS